MIDKHDLNELVRGKFDDSSKQIDSQGGSSAVRRRMSIGRIYIELNLRAIKELEHVDFVKPEHILESQYQFDLYTKSGIAKLKIRPHSCFDYKERIATDTVYRITEFAKRHKLKYPDSGVYLIYQDCDDCYKHILAQAKKEKYIKIVQVDEFLNSITTVIKVQGAVDQFEKD